MAGNEAKVKVQARNFDPWLTAGALLLTLVGCGVILTAGFARSIAGGDGIFSRELIIQALVGVLCIPLYLFCASIPAAKWRQLVPWVLGAAIVGLLLVKVIGHEMSGAQRWIKLGPITLQPAEFAKAAVILYVAAVLAKRKPWTAPKLSKRADWAEMLDKTLIPKIVRFWPAILVGLICLCVEREPDLGTAAVIGAAAFIMFVWGGITRFSLVTITMFTAVGIGFMIYEEPYRLERITSHFHRWEDHHMEDIGYQTTQSEAAMASGGLTGVGIGAGRAKHMMPAATTDFALATVAEEAGFLGVLTVVGMMGFLVWRLIVMAQASATLFGRYLCGGVAIWMTIQATVNLMMANGTLPPIGIPFPFFSSGGSALAAVWIALGMCQSAAAESLKEGEEVETRRDGWRNRRARLSRA